MTPEKAPSVNVSLLQTEGQDNEPFSGLCAAAAPFTPVSEASRKINRLVTPPLAPARTPERDIPFGPLRTPSPGDSKSSIPAAEPSRTRLFSHPELTPEDRALLRGEQEEQAAERAYWTQWVIEAAEKERARRLNVLKQLQSEEEEEIQRRRQWAIATIEKEQEAMMREMFLDNMKNTQWFQSTISRFSEDYEVVCPNSWFGCTFSCMLKDLESHLERCVYRQVPDTLDQVVEDSTTDFYSYDVVCPNAVLGCKEICSRENLAEHLQNCPVNGISREKEWEERLEWRRSVIQATEKERERRIDEERAEGGVNGVGLSFGNLQRLYEEQTAMMQVVLHDEIVDFYQHRRREARDRRPWIEKAIAMVTDEIQLIWNHCVQVEGYGSFATMLHGESSDVDLVVFGATEEFNSTSQQCVAALANHLRQLSTFAEVSAITRASIPLLKLVVIVTGDDVAEARGDNTERAGVELRIPFDITFDEPHGIHHNGVASVTLVEGLAGAFYGLRELTLVLKHFLVERGLNDPYVGGLSSYGLLLMVLHVLQEQGALLSTVDGQKLAHAVADAEDLDEVKPAAPAANARWNPRYEAQCLKGELIAKEIVKQCSAKQRPKKTDEAERKQRRKARRAVLPSFVTGSEEGGEHETKPHLLGKLLMDFLQFYGNDFRQNLDQVSVVSWGEPRMLSVETPPVARAVSPPHASSPSATPTTGRSRSNSPLMLAPPLSRDGLLVIEDPLQPDNNVGKSCYRVSQVFRDFSDFLSFLTALIVRGSVMTTGKKKKDGAASTGSEHSSPASSASGTNEPTCRILKSVFAMKTREKRASLDFSPPPREQTSTTLSAS
jgi:non-canonical poly(A) RNA polymerase PAPD5/7